MARIEAGGAEIDPSTITAVRRGNAIWPGMLTFTGASFFVYLCVKLVSGLSEPSAGLYAQIAGSGVMGGIGAWLLARARYFYVQIDTTDGPTRVKGLSKPEQTALAERMEAARPQS